MTASNERRLAVQRLYVRAAFASDQPVCALKRRVQTDLARDGFRARLELRAEHVQRKAEAAGRTRAGLVACRAPERCLEQIGEAGEGGVDRGNLFRLHVLLRTEDR